MRESKARISFKFIILSSTYLYILHRSVNGINVATSTNKKKIFLASSTLSDFRINGDEDLLQASLRTSYSFQI